MSDDPVPAEKPPVVDPPVVDPPPEVPPVTDPPADDPPAEDPPVEDPSGENPFGENPSGDSAPTGGPLGELTESPPGQPVEDPDGDPMEAAIRLAEALIFASADVVTPRDLGRILPDDVDADTVIGELKRRYAGRGVELIKAGAGVMFRTAPDLAPHLRKVIARPKRLSGVAMETLAIIAYHQPVTRAEIEHIRGAALSQQTLDSLLELSLITPKGRRETPGRPTIWGTTPEFLSHFGIGALDELPRREDLLLDRR
jgi:segregation and condensation protein B